MKQHERFRDAFELRESKHRADTQRLHVLTLFSLCFHSVDVELRSLAGPDAVPSVSTVSRHVGGICTLSSARDEIRANKLMRAISFVTVNN